MIPDTFFFRKIDMTDLGKMAITLRFRAIDVCRDREFYESECPVEDGDRKAIQALRDDSAEAFWLEVVARRWKQVPSALPPHHWMLRQDAYGPSWHEQCDTPAAFDPIAVFLRDRLPWDESRIVFVVVSGLICFKTTWAMFIKYWKTFLIAKSDLAVVSLGTPEFVRMMDFGVVYTGHRDPTSSYDRISDLLEDASP